MSKILIAGQSHKTKNYERALEEIGVQYVTTLHVPDSTCYDGLLLPGGGDIDPGLFGQIKTSQTRIFDAKLDRIQLAVLKTFLQDRKPVLGICKGMQLINIFFGGDMYQHLPTAEMHQYIETAGESGKDNYHEAYSIEDSWVHQLYGPCVRINSAHHQGVHIPGQSVIYSQYAKDGVVEALNHKFLPVWGTQWHPERLKKEEETNTADGLKLLKWFAKITQNTVK